MQLKTSTSSVEAGPSRAVSSARPEVIGKVNHEENHVKYAVFAGRQLFSMIFIIASARHFTRETIDSAARHHVPLPLADYLIECLLENQEGDDFLHSGSKPAMRLPTG